MVSYRVEPGDPLYRAWKKAINSQWINQTKDVDAYTIVNEVYGCKTAHVDYYLSNTGFTLIRSADLEFNEECNAMMFILQWT